MADIAFHCVRKAFGDKPVLRDLSLVLPPDCISALVGRSGCGKSTLLKLCNGLERPDAGHVEVFGAALDYADLPSVRRRMGYAVQHIGLFPHLTIRRNITLVAELERWSSAAIEERLAQLLALVELDPALLDELPYRLSGGQQQRVGLCRAMFLRPGLLLLDEPFAAIDPLTRRDIHRRLLALTGAEPVTTVLVTHDMAEALLLAEHIVVLGEGVVQHAVNKTELLRSYPGQEPNELLLALMAQDPA